MIKKFLFFKELMRETFEQFYTGEKTFLLAIISRTKNRYRIMKLEKLSDLYCICCGRTVCVTLSKRLEINFEYYRCRGAPRWEASTLLVWQIRSVSPSFCLPLCRYQQLVPSTEKYRQASLLLFAVTVRPLVNYILLLWYGGLCSIRLNGSLSCPI